MLSCTSSPSFSSERGKSLIHKAFQLKKDLKWNSCQLTKPTNIMAFASLEICTPVNFCVLVSYINILLLILHVAFPSSIYTWSTLVRSFVTVSESVPWMWIAIFFIVHTYTCIFMSTWKRKEYMYRCLILKQLQSYVSWSHEFCLTRCSCCKVICNVHPVILRLISS